MENFQYNSLFSYDHIKANPYDWQSHTERISDFVTEDKGLWWKKVEFCIEFFNFDSLDQVPNNLKPNHFRSESAANVSTNLKTLWESIVQSKTTLPTAFILYEAENNDKEIISTNLLKPYIETQNHKNLLIKNEMRQEIGYEDIRNNNSITEQLCDNDFINCDSMRESKDKVDECNEVLRQDAALNSIVNSPETMDSKTFKTFKINKTSTNVPNTTTHSKYTKQKKHKTENL